MPIVTSWPLRATSTASVTQSRKASASGMTWSAANDPMTASGSRASTTAAASPIAAIESRGAGSASSSLGSQRGQLLADGVGVRRAGHDDHPLAGQRLDPVEGLLEQAAPGPGEVVQELRVTGPRQRPQACARPAGGDDGPEAGDV